ncbi:MAG: BREX system P-loop protein BrxC, partial [Promethearchaeota archaeon]
REIEEYVVTEQLEKYFLNFFDDYANSARIETEKIGIWISGFFGSGKSHFAKIIGHLIKNDEIKTTTGVYKKAHEIFKNRLIGCSYENDINRSLFEIEKNINSHMIMFQIQSESDQLSEKSITKTMYQMLLKFQDLSEHLQIAELELDLILNKKYDEFKQKIEENEGRKWKEIRQSLLFSKKPIKKALYEISSENFSSEEDAEEWYKKLTESFELSPVKFTKRLLNFLDKNKSDKISDHFIFIIDEIGQYIGDSNNLLLELQSIAEQFAVQGKGKLWLIVTAQEKLDEIIEGVKGQENEFAKIKDRFYFPAYLTSENIKKVLEERILKKKNDAEEDLKKIYAKYLGILSFISGFQSNRSIEEINEDNFVKDYPFLSYQIELIQNIFANIRKEAGHTRKITGTERSMINGSQSIFKDNNIKIAESDLTRLITFNEIYDQIISEINSETVRDISQAASLKINPQDDSQLCYRALKCIYLLQQLDYVPNTLENIIRVLYNDLSFDNTEFEKNVKAALDELINANFIVEDNGIYRYLSKVEKNIEEDISRTRVKIREISYLARDFLKEIFKNKNKVNYKKIKYFNLRIDLDEENFSSKGDILIKIYSPLILELGQTKKDDLLTESLNPKNKNVVFWIPNESVKIKTDLEKIIKTNKVIEQRKKNPQKSKEEKEFLRQKEASIKEFQQKIIKTFENSLKTGFFIYDRNIEDLTDKSKSLEKVLEEQISENIPYIYSKFEEFKVVESNIKKLLKEDNSKLKDIEPELKIFDSDGRLLIDNKLVKEIFEKIKEENQIGNPITGKDILDYFSGIPYGWEKNLIRYLVVSLFRNANIFINYNTKNIYDYKKAIEGNILINSRNFNKCILKYEKGEDITLADRKKIKDSLKDIFEYNTEDNIIKLSEGIDSCLNKLINENKSHKIIFSQNNCTLKDIFYKVKEISESIINNDKFVKKFQNYLEQEEILKEIVDYHKKIKDFIDNKRILKYKVFNKLHDAITVEDVEIASEEKLNIENYIDLYKEIIKIIDNKEIIEKFQDFNNILDKLLDVYETLYAKLHQKRLSIYTEILNDLRKIGIPDKYFSGINNKNYICNNLQFDSEKFICKKCKKKLENIDAAILAAENKKERIIKQYNDDQAKKTKTPQIHRMKISSRNIKIQSMDDFTKIFEELKKEIEELLKKGKNIIL